MAAPERFETARMRAERLAPEHLADLIPLHLDPEVSRYLGGVRGPEATAEYLRVNLDHWDRHGFGLWVLRNFEGRFLGRAGLRHIEVDGRPEVEVAYTFHRHAWDRGLAGEITSALVDLGWTAALAPSLVGVVMVNNAASRRVLVRTGFAEECETMLHTERCAVYRLEGPIAASP